MFNWIACHILFRIIGRIGKNSWENPSNNTISTSHDHSVLVISAEFRAQ
jgi:hypothetical protein